MDQKTAFWAFCALQQRGRRAVADENPCEEACAGTTVSYEGAINDYPGNPGLMQTAYIISAYKRADLLFSLVHALGRAPIAIHLDRKSDIQPEVKAQAEAFRNVTLLPRHVCHWGLFGHVRASLEGMNWFMTTRCSYAMLLTGQCYPIKSNATIESEVKSLQGRSLIEIARYPNPEWRDWQCGGYVRLDRFWFKVPGLVQLRTLKLWTRRPPYGLHPYGGGGYWCLSREAIEYILNYVASHPKLTRYFKTTWIPDETFFHTILGNSPLRDMLESKPIHYMDWSGGGASPATLTKDMLPEAMASDAWFARKFEDLSVIETVESRRARL